MLVCAALGGAEGGVGNGRYRPETLRGDPVRLHGRVGQPPVDDDPAPAGLGHLALQGPQEACRSVHESGFGQFLSGIRPEPHGQVARSDRYDLAILPTPPEHDLDTRVVGYAHILGQRKTVEDQIARHAVPPAALQEDGAALRLLDLRDEVLQCGRETARNIPGQFRLVVGAEPSRPDIGQVGGSGRPNPKGALRVAPPWGRCGLRRG